MIRAAVFCQPDEGPVDSGRRIAQMALEALKTSGSVSITMESVSGASSSFFNVIFAELAAALGVEMVRERVAFVGLSKTQSLVEGRSRAAVLGS